MFSNPSGGAHTSSHWRAYAADTRSRTPTGSTIGFCLRIAVNAVPEYSG